jgi:hypothetical protein
MCQSKSRSLAGSGQQSCYESPCFYLKLLLFYFHIFVLFKKRLMFCWLQWSLSASLVAGELLHSRDLQGHTCWFCLMWPELLDELKLIMPIPSIWTPSKERTVHTSHTLRTRLQLWGYTTRSLVVQAETGFLRQCWLKGNFGFGCFVFLIRAE